ncbi:MAG: hypothetical protein N2Z67_02505 [Acetobacteraceae bacterium]|nr:hypothetical protein [Acetobacteraceae bacterium]
MSIPIAAERRVLSEADQALVAASHYPTLGTLPPEEVQALARRLRERHEALREQLRAWRRARRGRDQAPPAPPEEAATVKKQIFAAALRRVNKRLS